jgi:hypothetical protein
MVLVTTSFSTRLIIATTRSLPRCPLSCHHWRACILVTQLYPLSAYLGPQNVHFSCASAAVQGKAAANPHHTSSSSP